MTRVLTWNIQWARGLDGRVDLDRIAERIVAGDPDVICLQEMAIRMERLPGRPRGDQFAALQRRLPGYAGFFAPGVDLPGRRGRAQFGVAIFSRFPVLQVFRHSLPWPADPLVPSMQRAALEATIAAPAGVLRVITTHLEYYSAAQRRAQIEALRRLYAEGYAHALAPRSAAEADAPFAVLPRGTACLLCGDFNFAAASADYDAMLAPLGNAPALVDAWARLHPGRAHAPTAGVHVATFTEQPECFDFFFAGGDAGFRLRAIEVDAETRASDHQPVMLALE